NSQISREHRIEEIPENIFHILGGKLTSHRLMAAEALDLLRSRERTLPKSPTHSFPLQDQIWKPERELTRLEKTYGRFAGDILALDQTLTPLSKEAPQSAAEVVYAI